MSTVKLFALLAIVSTFLFSCQKESSISEEENVAASESAEVPADSILVPNVSAQTVKDTDGNIESYSVTISAYVPDDSNVSSSSVEKSNDEVEYRHLTMYYDGTSEEYSLMSVTLQISKEDIGVSEKGIYVTVALLGSEERTLKDPEDKGISVDWEDLDDDYGPQGNSGNGNNTNNGGGN